MNFLNLSDYFEKLRIKNQINEYNNLYIAVFNQNSNDTFTPQFHFIIFEQNGDKQGNKNIFFKISKSFKNSLLYSPQINKNIYINNKMIDISFIQNQINFILIFVLLIQIIVMIFYLKIDMKYFIITPIIIFVKIIVILLILIFQILELIVFAQILVHLINIIKRNIDYIKKKK